MAKHKTDPALLSVKSYRFHKPHAHTLSAFGDDWFALKAEAFARFFGTPKFLIGQTIFVAIWISREKFGVVRRMIFFILFAASSAIALAGPLTTNLIPPKVEADYLKIPFYNFLL